MWLMPCAAGLDIRMALQMERTMTPNVGGLDRIVRIVIGLALVAATLFGVIGAWGWIGVVVAATGVFRVCPAYLPFGFKTCSTPTAGNAKP
jgi:hypothetical protein